MFIDWHFATKSVFERNKHNKQYYFNHWKEKWTLLHFFLPFLKSPTPSLSSMQEFKRHKKYSKTVTITFEMLTKTKKLLYWSEGNTKKDNRICTIVKHFGFCKTKCFYDVKQIMIYLSWSVQAQISEIVISYFILNWKKCHKLQAKNFLFFCRLHSEIF